VRKFEEEVIEEETTSNRKDSGEQFEDQLSDEYEEEEVVKGKDDEWEDVDEDQPKEIVIDAPDEDMEEEKVEAGTQERKQKEVYLGNQDLKKDEELVFDNSAYEMLHRATVEWPSLSIDILQNDRFDMKKHSEWFPQYVNKLDPALLTQAHTDMEDDTEESKEPLIHMPTNYPLDAYVVAGSQATKRSDNRIYVMKWTNLSKTLEDEDDDGNDEDAKLYYE
jgi:ribosome assembly protein RRB1